MRLVKESKGRAAELSAKYGACDVAVGHVMVDVTLICSMTVCSLCRQNVTARAAG